MGRSLSCRRGFVGAAPISYHHGGSNDRIAADQWFEFPHIPYLHARAQHEHVNMHMYVPESRRGTRNPTRFRR